MACFENNKLITTATEMDVEIVPDLVDETSIQPILEEAMKPGVFGRPVVLAKTSNDMATSNMTNGEQITINLPFAGTKLSVELMFHSETSNIPPDFVWLSDDFPQDPEAYGRIASAWNPSDKCCLRNYLAELVKTYKIYQVMQLNNFSNIETQYASLISEGFPDEQLEVYCDMKNKKVKICIRLHISEQYQDNLPVLVGSYGTLYAALIVTFGADGAIMSRGLSFSPFLEHILSKHTEAFHLPPVSSSLNLSYLTDLTKSINGAIAAVSRDFIIRRQLVATLMELYGDRVIDFDEMSYAHATLYFVIDQYRCIAHLSLSPHKELTLYALDVLVGNSNGDNRIPHSEKIPLTINETTDKKKLRKAVHDAITTRIFRFISAV